MMRFLPRQRLFSQNLRLKRTIFILGCAICVSFLVGGCETTGSGVSRETAELRASAKTEHAIYRSLGAWKRTCYRNKSLLAQATAENTTLQISLTEQRGILLVNGAIAMDFPVASGKSTHPTPTGLFHIMAKEKDYRSNLYGRIYDAAGAVVVGDADSRTSAVPPGGSFVGASMPYWMRLTDSGVGMHVGYVPGVPASHGCIRLRTDNAKEIFEIVRVGSPVLIAAEAPVLAVK